jgi:ubiquinone/menaquinone biosynthesis C-methylase UbiE
MSTVNYPKGLEHIRAVLRRRAFEELYSHFAWAYDWVSGTFFLGQWRLWQLSALRYVEGTRVLEIGMGTGDMQLALSRKGYEAWGIDFSPQMLTQARRKAPRLGVQFNMCRARAQALPFPSSYFNSVISTFPSDYIIDPQTLGEISRVLRPGGRVVIVPGGWLHPKGKESHLMEWVSRVVYGDRSGGTGVEERGEPTEKLKKLAAGSTWIGLLSGRMADQGFAISSRLLSNEQGSVLVVVGEKSRI